MRGMETRGRTTYRIEDVLTLSDVDGLFEPKRDLRHETEKERRGRDGPCRGSDDGAGADDVRFSVALL
jgi:hypothetical protein